MPNLNRLRDQILTAMKPTLTHPSGWTAGGLHDAFVKAIPQGQKVPAGRGLFNKWFHERAELTEDSSFKLLQCIPALAIILDVKQYELYRAAGLLPPEAEAAMALSEAARDFRYILGRADETLTHLGLSTSGEGLIVDRLLQGGLDYRIEVWPVVRGKRLPLHFRSWIVLRPVEPVVAKQRPRTSEVERMPRVVRREHIRRETITESMWRSLGLRWRDPIPREWPGPDEPDLFMELPAGERNRDPDIDVARKRDMPWDHIVCISGVWSHAEGVSTLIAEALSWGAFDLRYQGFSLERERDEKIEFCEAKLKASEPYFIWAISERAEFLRGVKSEFSKLSDRVLVIWCTFGPETARAAAHAWRIPEEAVQDSLSVARDIAVTVNRTKPIIKIDYSDLDMIDPDAPGEGHSRDMFADEVRFSAARVLNLLYKRAGGPPVSEWGEKFATLRNGSERTASIPDRDSLVSWIEPADL